MVKNTLFLKSIRDMKKTLAQFISIFLMCMIAMMFFSGLDTIRKSLVFHAEQMYQASNISDLWISIHNPVERDLWKIKRIDGIESAQWLLTGVCDVDLPDNPSLRIYATPKDKTQNLPYLLQGEASTLRGAVLDQNFAEAHGLDIGDRIKIEVNSQWLSYTIEALALNSEHIFGVKDSASMLPDSKKYGFIMVNDETISKAYDGEKIHNQIAVLLKENTDINEIENELEKILGKRLSGVIDHQDHKSVGVIVSKVVQFQTLSVIFPTMFFIVAALITLSTMVRLVEDQRSQIGLLKALGYRKRMIIWHYTSYGIVVGMFGALFGLLLGSNFLGRMMLQNFKIYFAFPDYGIRLNIWGILLCFIIIGLCTGGVSCYSCLSLLRENSAELIRAKPPKKGIAVWLESFPKQWEKLRLQYKLIMRNTARNKLRMIMSILGVTGCMALILSALSLNNMMGSVTNRLFEEVYSYDQRISIKAKTSQQFIASLNLDGIQQDFMEQIVQLKTAEGQRKMGQVTIFREQGDLVRLMKADGTPVPLPERGVLITRKLAKTLNVGSGDWLTFKLGNQKDQRVEIKDTIYMASGQAIYMNKNTWEELGGRYSPSALLVKWNKDAGQSFLGSSKVSSVIDREQQKIDFQKNMSTTNFIVMMLITFGSILAFVVIYNMSLLNFHERLRDLSTLKVLGFHKKEIQTLVLAENVMSVMGGIIFGIPMGKLAALLIASGFSEDFDLLPQLTSNTIFIAVLMTILFMMAVNYKVAKKMNKIDMLEALKSVE